MEEYIPRNSPLVYQAIDVLFDAGVSPEAVKIFADGLRDADDPVKLAHTYLKSRKHGWGRKKNGGK